MLEGSKSCGLEGDCCWSSLVSCTDLVHSRDLPLYLCLRVHLYGPGLHISRSLIASACEHTAVLEYIYKGLLQQYCPQRVSTPTSSHIFVLTSDGDIWYSEKLTSKALSRIRASSVHTTSAWDIFLGVHARKTLAATGWRGWQVS